MGKILIAILTSALIICTGCGNHESTARLALNNAIALEYGNLDMTVINDQNRQKLQAALDKVIKDYPDTVAATDARKELDKVGEAVQRSIYNRLQNQ